MIRLRALRYRIHRRLWQTIYRWHDRRARDRGN